MSLLPYEDGETESRQLVIQKTEVTPSNLSDPPGVFTRTIDRIRIFIGMKPLYLAERFVEAKVQQVQNDADATRLAAIGAYELIAAQARLMDAKSDALRARTNSMIEAQNAETEQKRMATKLAEKLYNAKGMSPEEALAEVEDVVRRIENAGGSVEFDLRALPAPKDGGDGDS